MMMMMMMMMMMIMMMMTGLQGHRKCTTNWMVSVLAMALENVS